MNPNENAKNGSPVIMGVWAVILLMLAVGMAALSWWSYLQTKQFTDDMFGPDWPSVVIAFVIQFLPTPARVIAARLEATDPDQADLWRAAGVVSTVIDGVTNIVTFYRDGSWKDSEMIYQYAKLLLGVIICALVTQAEEVMAHFLALSMEMTNEVRKAAGRPAWKWAEWGSKVGRDAGYGDNKKKFAGLES